MTRVTGFDLQRLLLRAGDLAGRERDFAELITWGERGAVLAGAKDSETDGTTE